jgi:hypothetical protein
MIKEVPGKMCWASFALDLHPHSLSIGADVNPTVLVAAQQRVTAKSVEGFSVRQAAGVV